MGRCLGVPERALVAATFFFFLGLAAAVLVARWRLPPDAAAFAFAICRFYIVIRKTANDPRCLQRRGYFFAFRRRRRFVLRAAPFAAVLRTARLLLFLFLPVIGMSNDSSALFGSCDSHPPKRKEYECLASMTQ